MNTNDTNGEYGAPRGGIFRAALRTKTGRTFLALLAGLFVLGAVDFLFWRAPVFQEEMMITIPNGATLSSVASLLETRGIIRSPFWFKSFAVAFGGEHGVLAGDYLFIEAQSLPRVAWRVLRGDFEITAVKVVITEGMTVREIANTLSKNLVGFDVREFFALTQSKEGYLFPDTYLFLPNVKPSEVIQTMENNFTKRIALLNDKIKSFGKPLRDVVTMASILEAEARTTETRRVVSGILWKRLARGMPLQVDAPFEYTVGKNTFQLTTEDLQTDSPYNTYLHKGLTPTPIGNPGLDALFSAVNPLQTPYYFYLSDRAGNMHYARTFDEHLNNKALYLH